MAPEDDPLFDPEDDRPDDPEAWTAADELALTVWGEIWPESIDV